MKQVTYNCIHPFVANPPGQHGHMLNRPWAEVVATFNGHTHRVWCLVDTGADDSILDLGTAAVLQINVRALQQTPITTAGGQAPMFGLQPNVHLDFAGAQVTANVLFGLVAVPLLGRSALLGPRQIEAGFDAINWQHT